MFNDELRTFLSRPHIARMSTIDSNGYPHTVPVWYDVDGDEIVITAPRHTKKIGHIKANAKGCISIGGGPDDGGGYLFKGEFTITDDNMWYWLDKMTRHYEPAEQAEKDLAEWATWDITLIRMKPQKIIKV
jgi:predicted pyridoxine 5'-phosphate oxidase superfamily flavin-nucleotide-binding protein